MPNKKAPAAVGENKKAASPKTEKPADGAVAEKKPAQQKNQPRQGKDAAGGDHAPRGHKDNAAHHHKEGAASSPAGEKRTFTLSEDPEEAAIQKKLNAIDDEIASHRAVIDKITTSIDQKMSVKKKLIAEKQELRKQNAPAPAEGASAEAQKGQGQSFKVRNQEVFDKLKEARRQKQLKVAEIKEMRKNLAGAADEKNYLKNLDDKIKELEAHQASSALALAEEKKLIAEIGRLQNSKKNYKAYTDLNEAIKKIDTDIAALEESLGKIKEEADVYFSKRKEEREVFAASDNKIDAVQEEITKEQATRSGLYDKITELRTQQTTIKNELKEFRDKRREQRQAEYERTKQERQAEYERVKQQRQAENQRRADEKKAKELKRIQEELEQEPYSEELELCIQLIKYLEPFVPKVPKAAAAEGETGAESPKPAATTPPPLRADNAPEGTPLVKEEEDNRPLSKRGKKKPQKAVDLEKELRHNVETFLQFEKVSIVPPSKLGEVEKTVSQLKEKKVYYQKRAEEKLQKRKAELEAEAKAIHNPQSTTTTTTTTTEESKTSEETTPSDE